MGFISTLLPACADAPGSRRRDLKREILFPNCIDSFGLYVDGAATEETPMNLQQLRYARALAECGSFVQAAQQCAVTQPTLSNGIAQLERDLGQQLFARTTRTVRLTQAGEHLLPDIADILNAQAALMARARALSNPERRLIRIGVSPVVGVKFVDLVIEPFRLENRNVDVIFRELNLAEMLTHLEGGQLDLVFGPADATPARQLGFELAALRLSFLRKLRTVRSDAHTLLLLACIPGNRPREFSPDAGALLLARAANSFSSHTA